ncbi:hypothetical protein B0T11DRAFT_341298 [Plectosphaerella cucumerina]|uniref:Uncharacterized protein n=1 Tax=Plectosphaerella cucumerina TaxID=40658 RepID=A0A8K0TGJ0_9PEZI|nr:hypothetical protein B0T11DRAFT_341298 [Plectosphaerella cucumerina]
MRTNNRQYAAFTNHTLPGNGRTIDYCPYHLDGVALPDSCLFGHWKPSESHWRPELALSGRQTYIIPDFALVFSLDSFELKQNSLTSSRNRITHKSRTPRSSVLSCQPLKSVNMLREAEWFSKTRREAASVLAALDPESLTRCLTRGISTTGTSNPGWRLDTQGYITNPPAFNIQLQPNRDRKRSGRNRRNSTSKTDMHGTSAACIIVAEAFTEIDTADVKEGARKIGQTMKDALLLSFEKSSSEDSTGVVNVHIDGAGVIHTKDTAPFSSTCVHKRARGLSCTTCATIKEDN